MRLILRILIKIYRYTLSPLLGGQCRFHPSCSVYAEHAIIKHGAWKGSKLALIRLLKCGPWHPGGFDPVP